jgi:hypothetical protein
MGEDGGTGDYRWGEQALDTLAVEVALEAHHQAHARLSNLHIREVTHWGRSLQDEKGGVLWEPV